MTTTRRVVPVLTVDDIATDAPRWASILGLRVVMDHGWIVTLADDTLTHQLSLMTRDETAPVNPDASIEVDDVDAAHALAVEQGMEIVHGPHDEPWGVRRFFVRDANGNVVNVLGHR